MIGRRNKELDIVAFQNEMEDAFRIDCSEEDLTIPEARKCFREIRKSRRRVNRILKLSNKVLCKD